MGGVKLGVSIGERRRRIVHPQPDGIKKATKGMQNNNDTKTKTEDIERKKRNDINSQIFRNRMPRNQFLSFLLFCW